jgi:GT2 family glycosyltransferase
MHDRERRLDWAHGAAMLIRRDALNEIGGFDERYFFYAEDLEWCWRAKRAGWEIWIEPKAVVQHVHSASGDQLYATARERAHLRNALRFYRRAHGIAPATAWWGTHVIGATWKAGVALRRRDRAGARRWASYAKAQLQSPFVRERRPR